MIPNRIVNSFKSLRDTIIRWDAKTAWWFEGKPFYTLLTVFFVGGWLYLFLYEPAQWAGKGRAAYIESCSGHNTLSTCSEHLEEHHKTCFSANYDYGASYLEEDAHLSIASYVRCVSRGYEVWSNDQRKKQRERVRLTRELLNP